MAKNVSATVPGGGLLELDREARRELLTGAAASALAAWGLRGARVEMLEQKTTITFRVDAPAADGVPPQRFLLRACQLGAYERHEVASEGVWLLALREAGLVVPEPVPTLDGSLVTSAFLPEWGGARWCLLYRWVPGRMVESEVTPEIIEQVGELAGRIHGCAERFVPPPGFSRPRWDCDRLFGRDTVIPAGRGEPLITARVREILDVAAREVRGEVESLGEAPEVFGMIHKDLEPDNTVWDEGRAHAIDFADCGWGWYLYDIAASLLPLREKKGYPDLRAAFLRGYRRYRPLSVEHEARIETFLIARSLFTIRFMILTSLDQRPELQVYANIVIPMMVGEIRRFLERRTGAAPQAERGRPGKTTVVQFLSTLRAREVRLWAEGEKLRFSAPQRALTPELRVELAERKAEVLAFLHQGQAAAHSSGPARRPAAESVPAPLSFAQQRLWFLDQLHPGSPEYNIARAVRLSGDLRADVLARSLNEVIRRHTVLRTTFTTAGGEPRQIVAPALSLRLPVVDLRALPEEDRLAEAQRIIDSEGQRPFDLARGPLARVCLLRLADSEHLAASTMHHIVSDGWSTGLLFREMGLLYSAFLASRPSPLPELLLQYADFAWWQREVLEGEVQAGQLAWWKEQLAGAAETLDLPTDRPRSAVGDSRGGKVSVALPPDLSARLRELGRAQGATLFMVLYATWNALLARTAGQEDIVLGVPIANRNRTEIEPLIGFFVNTLALRTRLEGDPEWRELLGQVRRTTVGAYAHQDLPFETLVAELRPDRSLAGNPLFQVMFALQKAQREESLLLPGLTMSSSPLGMMGGPAKFDLTLSLQDGEGSVKGSLEYRAELFDPPTIVRLLEHWRTLLEGLAADPDLRLSELPLLSEAERHQLLVGWNDTAGVNPALCLHEIFAERAGERPDAVAVAASGAELTYGELRARAGRLACRLRALGVSLEAAVGLYLERSACAVTAMLAILEAGGAFVPLDPSYPAERLRQMVEDADLRLVLTESSLRERLPELPGVERTVCLDLGGETDESGDSPALPATADNLAYVMFTSGSTGRPKGVAVTHRAVARLVLEASYARLGPDEVFLQYAPLSFDASTLEIWGCLLNGSRLVIPPQGRISLQELGRVLVDQGVTTLWLTAGLFHQMVEERPEGMRPVRHLLTGGDVLSPLHVRRALEARPGLTLINGYGPTENTTFTCCHPMTSPQRVEAPVPIGRPITGTRAVLLDRWLSPASVGVVGELYAAGHGLARGYAVRPDLTAERFVPHPCSAEPGERLYRTGDLARYRPDGTIDFLGRGDHQVKIRGFRIELGEIETVLARQPGVSEAVVLVREDAPGGKRLVACVVTGKDVEADVAGLCTALRESLPDYMVPSAFVFLDVFPLGPTGKVDRRALARIGSEAAARLPDERPEDPRDPVEELLAGVWAEVLRVERVGRDHDFFAIGGHSLLATQVISRIRETFGVELPLQLLFDLPTVASLAEAVRERLREGRGAEASPILPVPRGGVLPLSFAQQRLWFLDRFDPGSAAYNIPAAVRLSGRLEPPVLERAAREVAHRHEALRTTFAESGGRPMQVVAPEPRLDLPLIDFQALPMAQREGETLRLAAVEALRPFDLEAGPLLRATLLRLDDMEHVALITFHHIVADGWSMGVFLEELAAVYAAFFRGEPSPLPELPVQYADFAAWQRSWLTREVLASELAYWQRQLAGAPRSLELPTDRPRPAMQTFRGRSLPVALSAELSDALGHFGRREGVTPFMTLLAAFQVLMGRLARTEDVTVGTPIAGRNRREIEGLIGFFVNTLVLRADLGGDPTVRVLFGRVRRMALDGYAHQDVPFERLVEELQPERDLSFHPLFQVLLALQNAPRSSFELPGLTLAPLASEGGTAKFDLTLSLQESETGLRGSFEHNTDLFDGATVERWLGSFRVLLEAIVEAPERRLSDLPWLAEAERRQILADWNATGSTGPADLCLHEMFEAQVERTPNAPALVHDGTGLTYRELDRLANRLAHRLRALGVGAEERVAVCLERGLDLVVALLAVLKAGGAYVPLDPVYPPERLAFMVEDARGRVLLTRQSLLHRLPPGVEPLCLDGDAALLAAGGAEAPARQADPGCLAYVIYTSGSTGRPKGAAIEHRSAVALARWAREIFPAEDLDGVLASTSVCFDLSIFELFVPLSWGGRVIMAENALELPAIAARGEDVRLVNTVPSAMAELVRQSALPASVRTVNLAGEVLQGALAEQIYRCETVRRVFNLYGPSEDTTYSTFAIVVRGSGEPAIGRPITGSRAYVLDATGSPIPVGVPGELYLGGEGLARGYLGRPARTAASFVPDAFGGEPGGRLYRTGDLVRLLPGGDLQYLGRIDHQVKVRGFRIELGEIEAALGRHPGVRAAAVLVHEDRPGDKRLVAYVAPEGAPAPSPGELRETLRERLPDYMLPADFVFLEALPLSPNGKLDRRALCRIVLDRSAATADAEAPQDTTEELLAGIWTEVLGRSPVGSRESFFEIGGHSLLATQVISRVREVFRVELPLQRLFASPTIAELATAVRAAREAGTTAAPAMVPVPRDRDLPLSFAQQRLWFLDQLQPGSDAYNIPAAVRLHGPLDAEVLERVFDEVARRHESLRTAFAAGESGPVQVIALEPRLPLPRIDLCGLPGERRQEEARALAAEEARRPFDLAAGPLIRIALLRLEPQDHLLLAAMHHAVSDGWSAGVLLRELAALYAAFLRREPSPLPPLPVQYADFAVWQRSWLTGEVLEAEIAHWRTRLADAPRSLELPLDRPRSAVQTFRGAVRETILPLDLGAALAALGRREGATLFMVLLAAFQALLGRSSGGEDFLVGSPIAGRNRREVEGLIGLFVNTLVLRADLSGDPTFLQLLTRVRATALDAFEHQDLPLERLVEELQAERDLSRNPLFQVAFALQNAPMPELRLPGLTLAPLALPADTAKFDLTLSLRQTEAGVTASLEFNTDLFDGSTIDRLLARYRILLAAVAEGPDRRLSEAPLLTPGELRQLIEWNETPLPAAEVVCVHHRVAAWAEAAPGSPAVVMGEAVLTYGELDARANRLAHRLRSFGVGPEVTVGVCLRRSPAEVVALLGVLKAGGAYLPLDPVYPKERQAFLLEDSGARVLLTETTLASALPETVARLRELIELDREEGATGEDSAGPPPDATTVDHLAYVIYTSGSTGRPKGVQVEHRALLRLISWHVRSFEVTPRDRVAHLAGLAFDASVWELWPYLASGASIHIPDEETRTSATALRDWLLAEDVTLAFVPTPVAEGLLALEWPGRAALRALLTGGDKLHSHPATLLPFRLINNYGPTENTVVATSGEVLRCGPADRAPSIGRPIDGVRVYLVDHWLRLAPPGVPGEICLGGGNLARGYLGRPELTSERFVPDLFAEVEPGARMYRTGDLARWLPDGEIEFLGRLDEQVKIRGFRIEPGEIEAALARHPVVRECAVVACDGAGSERRLVAYVAGREVPGAGELRDFLRASLPDYMVPAAFVPLDALPLTPNGKVDRRALPAPDLSRAGLGEGGQMPRDSVELELARIWEELLGCGPVGIGDDFFELGGHSLLAVRLMGRIRERFGRRVPLTALFQGATVERLAALLRRELGPQRRSALVSIWAQGSRPPLFLVHPVGGNVLCYAELARHLGPDQPVWGIQAPEPEEGKRGAPDTIERMAVRYLEAVREVQPQGPYHLGGWSLGGVVAFEMARRIEANGEKVGLLAVIDAFGPAGRCPEELADEASLVGLFARDLGGLLGSPQLLSSNDLASLDPDDGLRRVFERAEVAGLLPPEVDAAELRGLFEIFRANLRALSRYKAGPYAGRIELFRSAERPLAAGEDPALGWTDLARGGVKVHDLPGTHYSLLRSHPARLLADHLREGLNAVRPRQGDQ